MIDIENEVFDYVAKAIRAKYPKAYVVGERLSTPSTFPCVSIVEMSNVPVTSTQTTDSGENHVSLMYEANVFSNLKTGRKRECKAVATVLDEAFQRLGMKRIMLQPIDNLSDASVYRYVGRYSCVVSKDKVVYRQ